MAKDAVGQNLIPDDIFLTRSKIQSDYNSVFIHVNYNKPYNFIKAE